MNRRVDGSLQGVNHKICIILHSSSRWGLLGKRTDGGEKLVNKVNWGLDFNPTLVGHRQHIMFNS